MLPYQCLGPGILHLEDILDLFLGHPHNVGTQAVVIVPTAYFRNRYQPDAITEARVLDHTARHLSGHPQVLPGTLADIAKDDLLRRPPS